MSEDASVESFAISIRQGWQKLVSTILEVAQICARADAILSPSEKKLLFETAPIKASDFSKLVRIARNVRLADEKVLALLPPRYTVIYDIACLSDEKFQEALDNDILKPTLRREELKKWRTGNSVATAPPRKDGKLMPDFYVGIRFTGSITHEQLEKLESHLRTIRDEFDIELVRPSPGIEMRRSLRRKKILKHMRFSAQQYVDEVLAGGNLSPRESQHAGPKGWELTNRSDENDIERVLKFIGKENKFKSILKAANAAYPSRKEITEREIRSSLQKVEKFIVEREGVWPRFKVVKPASRLNDT